MRSLKPKIARRPMFCLHRKFHEDRMKQSTKDTPPPQKKRNHDMRECPPPIFQELDPDLDQLFHGADPDRMKRNNDL